MQSSKIIEDDVILIMLLSSESTVSAPGFMDPNSFRNLSIATLISTVAPFWVQYRVFLFSDL